MAVTRPAPDEALPVGRRNRLFLVCGALSLLAIALGAWTCASNGIPTTLWARNLAAWLVGGLAAYGLARSSGGWVLPAVLVAAVVALAATLLGAGQLGVHRWLSLGPLSLNAAMLMLPAAVVAGAEVVRRTSWGWLGALAGLAVLAAQPDASQATAFGAALAWIAVKRRGPGAVTLAVLAAVALLVAMAWLRPDPLQPVPEVEGILGLAWRVSPALAGLALASLVLFSLAPGWLARGMPSDARLVGEALSLYFLVCAGMPFLGAFPVPLVGVGVSPALGAWLGVGVLAALYRAQLSSDPTN